MPPKSAVEKSENREEIDRLLIEGKSPRFVSDWLSNLDENPENISHTAINNYRKKHLNVREEATIKYQEKQHKKQKKKAVDKTVSDLEALDEIIAAGNELKLELSSLTPDDTTSQLDIENAKIKAKRLTIQAARAKHYIMKDEPAIIVDVKVGEMDDEERRLTKEAADALARQGEDKEES